MATVPPLALDPAAAPAEPAVAGRRRRRRSRSAETREALTPVSLAAAVTLALALIAGGAARPLSAMLIELAAIATLGLAIATFSAEDFRASRLGWGAAAVALLIAAIELIPLPFGLWSALPGRASAAAIVVQATGLAPAHALSLDPAASAATLAVVLPGLACFIAGLAAGPRTFRLWSWLVIAVACLGALLGAVQIAGGPSFYLYAGTHYGSGVGFFANRNHEADLLLIGMVLLGVELARPSSRTRQGSTRPLLYGLLLLLGFALVASRSRVGLLMLPLAAIAIAAMLRGRAARGLGPALLAVAGLTLGGVLLVYTNATVQHVLARYSTLADDLRFTIWSATLPAIAHYAPWGSGLGTFVPVYASVEPLDSVTQAYINHAHNDYLELLLEGGLICAVPMLAYAALLLRRVVAARAALLAAPAAMGALVGIAILLIHSAADYPLRTPALLTLFGVLDARVFGTRSLPA